MAELRYAAQLLVQCYQKQITHATVSERIDAFHTQAEFCPVTERYCDAFTV